LGQNFLSLPNALSLLAKKAKLAQMPKNPGIFEIITLAAPSILVLFIALGGIWRVWPGSIAPSDGPNGMGLLHLPLPLFYF